MAVQESARESAAEQFERGRDEARQIGADFAEIAQELQQLAAAEARLARAEARENMSLAIRGVILGVLGAVLTVLLVAFVFLTVMFVLNVWLQLWAAAVITTGVILALTAVVGALAYRAFQRFSVLPQRTIESLKEDLRWLKSQATSNGR
jgi:uncharacterized membrane protein YqjE